MFSKNKALATLILSGCLLASSFCFAQSSIDYNNDTIKIVGQNIDQYLGETVINIGRSLDDGNNLIGIGAPAENSSAGEFYIFSDINFNSDLTSENALKVVTGSATQRLSKTIGSFGDIDKDNQNDIIFVNPNTESISILLGSDIADYSTLSDLITLTADTLAIENANGRYIGNQIDIAGDVNGDGYDDILIGGPKNTTDTSNTNGRAYLLFGQDSFNDLADGNIATAADIIFEGTTSGGYTGYSVDILPDINQDGYDEILISSFDQSTETGYNVYLIYGTSSFADRLSSSTFDLSQADATFSYSNESTPLLFGENVKGIGDLNGDGYNEFMIAGPAEDNEKIFIFFGSEERYSGNLDVEETATVIINGDETYLLGLHTIQGELDINGDGYDDLVISEFLDPVSNSDSGSVFIFYGSEDAASLGTELTENNAAIVIENASTVGKIGISLAPIYDRNENGVDELAIGSLGYNSSTIGQAGIFELESKTATSPAGGAIEFFSDNLYSIPLTSTARQNTVYVQLSNADPDATETNIILMEADSTESHKTLEFSLYETTINSGLYRGQFRPVQTRTSVITQQLNTSETDTVTVQVKSDNDISNTFTTTNAPPIVTILDLEQIGTMNNTTVELSYTLTDYETDTCKLDEDNTQIQYSIDDGETWSNASVTGTLNNLTSSDQGLDYDSDSDKIVWDTATDIGSINGTINVRIQAFDETDLGDYSIAALSIDNESPDAPVLTQPTLNFAYSFTLHGTAEVNTTLYIFRNDAYLSTANVTSDGTFSVMGITVTDSSDRISAKAVDSFGFESPTSNEVSLSLSNYTDSITEGNFELTVNIPLGVTTNSETVSITYLANVDYDAPTLNQYLDIFELTYGDNDYTSFDENVTINITLSDTLATTNGVAVYYYDETTSTWSSDGITAYDITETSLSFITDHFSVFSVVQLVDPFLPEISSIEIDGAAVATNMYYSNDPSISTTLSDEDSYIASWTIEIYDDSTNVLEASYEETGLTSSSIDISFSPSDTAVTLSDSRYLVTISATDQYGNTQSKSAYFQVNESELLFSALHAPNPYNPNSGNLTFSYNTSQDVDYVYIMIFDQGQREVWSYTASSVSAGYYLLEWDGRHSNGAALPNGVYSAYCIAKNSSSVKKELLKIAIIR